MGTNKQLPKKATVRALLYKHQSFCIQPKWGGEFGANPGTHMSHQKDLCERPPLKTTYHTPEHTKMTTDSPHNTNPDQHHGDATD